jgi:D-serine deaminase-like pyridoxal phosphate-dependent protein
MMAKTPDDLRLLARTHSEAALLTLVAVMNHEDATPAARNSAANSILASMAIVRRNACNPHSAARYCAKSSLG